MCTCARTMRLLFDILTFFFLRGNRLRFIFVFIYRFFWMEVLRCSKLNFTIYLHLFFV